VNPQLVAEGTDMPNMIPVMRLFPAMTAEYVEEQWAQFKHFDINGDMQLDISEVMLH